MHFYCKNKVMKFLIIILAITAVNPVINAHENHDHKIYSWSNSKNETLRIDSISNGENLEDKKIKTTTDTKK